MECVLLGSGGMMPMHYRMLTALVVRLKGCNYLFDSGEGTQIGMKASKAGVKSLRVLAVTHLHADHCLGIPGVLMLRAQVENPGPLTIIGPPKIEQFITQTRETLDFTINYNIEFIEWSPDHSEIAYQDESLKILWAPLKHSTFCLGYRIEENHRPGRFLVEQAEKLGIPPGPLRGMLQRGQSIHLDDGTEIRSEQVMGEPRRGRCLAYVVDTEPTENVLRLCDRADMAFIEGMYLPDLEQEARIKQHMTIDDATRIAISANVHQAVLVHISPRYKASDLPELEKTAKSACEKAEMGIDLNRYHIPFPD
ncbi:ribonuclease Z [candidate division KSB1 bacterium]|nr:ribonuclease Z [candidate division KSB1 bacterium]